MTLSLGLIVALLVGLLVGVIVGYILRQGQVKQLTQSLKQSQKRQENLEQEHQHRLQQATLQLQQDYQAQLAEKIERYQDQLEERTALLDQEYRDRLAVLDQGRQTEMPESAQLPVGDISPGPRTDVATDIQHVEQQIKRQYEDRLKEAARKIQQAYEQHLRQKLKESRDFFQKDYEERLIQKIEHYETQTSNRTKQLEEEYEVRLQALAPHPQTLAPNQPTPGSSDTTATFPFIQPQPHPQMTPPAEPAIPPSTAPELPEEQVLALENRMREEYEQRLAKKIEHYQDDLAQRVQGLEEEYETRLQVSQQAQLPPSSPPEISTSDTAVIEGNIREQYEQKLAEKIEHYQDDLAQRVQSLEEEYENRFQVVQQGQSVPGSQPEKAPENSVNPLLELSELSLSPDSTDEVLNSLPDIGELSVPFPDLESTTEADTAFSLDQILAADSDQSLNLDNEFDSSEFNLDELLFDQTEETSENNSLDLDDIDRLS